MVKAKINDRFPLCNGGATRRKAALGLASHFRRGEVEGREGSQKL